MTETSKPHSGLEADVSMIRWAILDAPKNRAVEAEKALARLVEQKEAADRVLAVADQLAEWCRVTTSVEGVFSNNLGAQAQAQGMANLVVRYAATRESYPASEHH